MRSPLTSLLVLLAVLLLVVGGAWVWVRRSAAPTPAATASSGTAPSAAALGQQVTAGFAALRSGDLAAARRSFEAVGPGEPDYPRALQGLAIAALQENELDTATETLERLVAIEPGNADDWVLLGRARFRSGQPDEAERAALRAIELDGGRADARYDLGLYRLGQDRLSEAIESYARAMQLDRDRSGYARALEDVARLDVATPDDPDTQYTMAFFANAVGDEEGERRHLERFLELRPEGPATDNARERLAELGAGGS